MIGATLGLYFARRFIVAFSIVFATVFALIYMLDFVELMRRAGDAVGAGTGTMAKLAFFRAPAIAEQVIPFSILFGSMVAFIGLSRRLELVIARAAGLSAWQFTLPALAVAILTGFAVMMAYNPVATLLKDRAGALEAQIFRRGGVTLGGEIWLRQRSVDGEAILRASAYDPETNRLRGVTAFVMDDANRLVERIEAQSADLRRGYWRFRQARVISVDVEPGQFETYLVASNLTADEIRSALGPAAAVSFWSLPAIVERLELAGLDATRYRLLYQTLLARPALLAAMVLLAACFSLKFLRSGGLAQMVLGGVSAGFGLYIATSIAGDLGNAGVVSTTFAAWVAPSVASALSVLTLLHREDG
ncbi:MAG: LPS export ABC transporter permease LptG [Hyphomicrobiales bacterium]|uniref:LPS export ABC transporter permease LptG n=1 Tax=Rhabdaerophilum calidifontis TaxID=2604328 RepID=UPI00123A274F|nr:LPS export ABC transporter permease LptG [Rhabdaerophilum calidifontis]MCA1953016.1 LPS export ABC transporter permease LptG [Hyphomicrobiales bacterium]